jgi:hypothetical protein
LESAYSLWVSTEARSQSNFWTTKEASIIKYGAVRGTFAIQLASFLMLIHPRHAGFAEISKGKSGFYKCVNELKRDSYGGDRNLSTLEATGEVEEVKRSLKSSGFRICSAWLDQNGCRWWRTKNNSLKKDVLLWDKETGRMFLQFCYTEFSRDRWKIQMYYADEWRDYSDYWVPFTTVLDPTVRVRLQKDVLPRHLLKPWVQELQQTSIHSSNWWLDKVNNTN